MSTTEASVQTSLAANQAVVAKLRSDPAITKTLGQMAQHCITAFQTGHRLYVAGNGGSAADAEHMAGELVGQFMKKGRTSLPVFALTQNTPTLTALANDLGYESVFAHQLEGLMHPGDIFLTLSTSGNSPNVIRAAQVARQKQGLVLGLTGERGGELANFCDLCLKIPETNTQRVQEAHILCIHILCELIESAF